MWHQLPSLTRRSRHNCSNISGEISLTATASRVRDKARRRDPRAPRDPRHGTRSGRPPAQRTDQRPPRQSNPSGASAARRAHRRTTRDPHPTSDAQPRTRTRGRATDETDASHTQFAAQPPDQAQSTAKAKGGSEATVKIAKADLVPTDHNLRDEYQDFAQFEAACEQFMAEVNTRPHRVTRRPPIEMLAEEHEHLHRLPRLPHTICFGQTRKVNWQSTISCRRRDLLGPARAGRRAGVGPDRRLRADRRARRRARRGRGRSPAIS